MKLDVLRNNPGVTEEEKKEQEQKQKDEQEKLDALNKSLKEKRKTELPTLYEPLLLNCDLLFAIADNLCIRVTPQQQMSHQRFTEHERAHLRIRLIMEQQI